jgi:hypothetical protein
MTLGERLLIIGFCLLVGLPLIWLGRKQIKKRQVKIYGDSNVPSDILTGKKAIAFGVQGVVAGFALIVLGTLFAFGVIG